MEATWELASSFLFKETEKRSETAARAGADSVSMSEIRDVHARRSLREMCIATSRANEDLDDLELYYFTADLIDHSDV